MIDFLIYRTKYYRLKNKHEDLKEENKELKHIIKGLKEEVNRLEKMICDVYIKNFEEYVEDSNVKPELHITKGDTNAD